MKILTIVGTRPEIIKMAPLIQKFNEKCEHILVHSGQHYSTEMDSIFFNDLSLPLPKINLKVGSLPPVQQVSEIMQRLDNVIAEYKPDVIVTHGDTNTTLGGALACAKSNQKGLLLAHIEAGARSGIRKQVEEINRKLVDQISDLLFAANEGDRNNLIDEGIEKERIFVTGNTVIESSFRMSKMVEPEYVSKKFGLEPGSFAVATFHRQESVDNKDILKNIIITMNAIGNKLPIIIPLHPRTLKQMKKNNLKLESKYLQLISPIGYKDMISLIRDARVCLTDSGGLQEEAAVLGTPSLVLRKSTEHMKYVSSGFHRLCDPQSSDLLLNFMKMWEIPPKPIHALQREPKIAEKILHIIHKEFE